MKHGFGRRECGAAMMLLMVILVMGAMFFVLRSLNASTMRADRYRVTQEALIQAKEALIARAVTDDDRPGSLPCPDTNDDGVAELFVGTACPSYIGRLPWKTLDLPDLRDSSGERLWYALSSSFRDHASAQPINSNTAGTLTITGTQAATNVAAIILAAESAQRRANGAAQSRSCTAGVCDSTAANYLDIASGIDNADGDTTFVAAEQSNTFNDRLIPILSDDIMPLVERRAGRELAQKLRDHFDAWQNSTVVNGTNKGFYPWAGSFGDPSTAQIGVSGTQHGAIPMSTSPLVWTSAPGNCSGVGTTDLTCDATIISILGITIMLPFTISAQVGNLGTRFSDPPVAANVYPIVGIGLGTFTGDWTMNKAQQRLDLSITGGSFLGVGNVKIVAKAPTPSSWLTSPSWLVTNDWHQVIYYSLSSGYALTGANSCVAGTSCVTVNNTTAPSNDKQAVVITTGRALPLATPTQTARPVATPAPNQYLESGNQNPAALILERNLRTSTFNDHPTIVRP